MRVNRHVVGLACVALCALVAGCGGGGGPEGAVKGWFKAMNAGKHADAMKFLTPALAEMANMDGGKGMSDEMTHNGTMTKIEIVSTEVRGEGATVKVRVHFKDGGVEDQEHSVVKQDGAWKVTI
jgi:hypothetical protein